MTSQAYQEYQEYRENRAKRKKRRLVARIAVVVLVLVGFLAFLDGVGTSLTASLTFFGSQVDPPSTEEIHRYEISAGLAVGCLIAATVLCFVFGRMRHVVATLLLLLVAVGGLFVFSVPSGRWSPPEPTQEPLPSYYRPCYSGSGDCN